MWVGINRAELVTILNMDDYILIQILVYCGIFFLFIYLSRDDVSLYYLLLIH